MPLTDTLDTSTVPVLRLALGDSVDDVTRRSDVPVRAVRDPLRDPPFIVAGKPMTVEYTRPGATIRFPIGMFTAVGVQYGHVVDLTISPHRHALPLKDALILVRDLEAMLERAGWKRSETYLQLDDVPDAVEAARHTVAGQAIGYSAALARWGGASGDTLTLSIRRQASADAVRSENAWLGKARPEIDHYLLSVDVQNAPVSEHYFRLAFPQIGNSKSHN